MSYEKLCVRKVSRELTGSVFTGEHYDPENYTYQTQLQNGEPTGFVYVIAWYTNHMINGVCTLSGREAVFIVNTDLQDLETIPTNNRIQVSMNEKWIYYGKSTINNEGYSSVLVNRTQLGIFAIASYCPVSTKGADIQIILGG